MINFDFIIPYQAWIDEVITPLFNWVYDSLNGSYYEFITAQNIQYIAYLLFIIAFIVVMLSSTCFSQTVTKTYTDTQKIVLPVPVAKQIVIDLLRGDSAFAQLKMSNQQIVELETMVSLKDSVIEKMKLKEENYNLIIIEERKKTEIYQKELKITQKELKRIKEKRTFTNIISGVLIGTLTYLYITK